jgi:ferritin-like metal-binding protein YciE
MVNASLVIWPLRPPKSVMPWLVSLTSATRSSARPKKAHRDVGLIFAGQKAEHYEIASYGGMIALAKSLGYYDIAEMLVLTLDEEKSADALLTQIAENQANNAAAIEHAED